MIDLYMNTLLHLLAWSIWLSAMLFASTEQETVTALETQLAVVIQLE
jgi:hypothetical protein